MAFETHHGVAYSKLFVCNSTYDVVETIILPLCGRGGNTKNLGLDTINQKLGKGEIVNINRGVRPKWILDWSNFASKADLTLFLKILTYNSDEYKGRGKKIFYLMPNSDKDYLIYKVNLVNINFDFKVLEALDWTEGYELPVFEFESVDLIDANDMIIEFPFSPALWIKSTDIVSTFEIGNTNEFVSKAIDVSGNFRNMTTGINLPKRIQSTLNGFPVMQFDGVNDYLRTLTFSLDQPMAIFFVGRQVTWADTQYIFDGFVKDNAMLVQDNATPEIYFSANALGDYIGGTGFTLNTFKHIGILNKPVTSSIRINSAAAVTGFAGNGGPDGITLGASGGTAVDFANVEIAEFIVFEGDFTTTQETTVRTYLMNKYGLT